MGLLDEFLHNIVFTNLVSLFGFEQVEMANFATFVDSMAVEVVALGSNMQDFEKQDLGTCFGAQASMAFFMHMIDPWVHY